jgi:type IV pilus assembly protein PilE
MRRQAGLTLVELVVVIAIMAILATIAYPLYTNQVIKSRRTEARVALNEIALAQERYFTVNGTYGTAAQLGNEYTDALAKMTDRNGDNTPDYYTIAMVQAAATYTITATAAGPQTADGVCTSFSLDSLGAKTATGSNPDACW